MKYRILSLSLALTLITAVQAQLPVPNSGFESWESTPMFSLDPVDWQTNNTQLLVSVGQDSLPYEGQWAMRVSPIPNGIGEEGYARVEIPTDYIPASLDFYAKWDRTATAGAGVNVVFFNGETQVYGEYWYSPSLNSEWTPVSIPLDQIEPIMTHVIIEVYVSVGDFAAGEGWISVDAMSFDNPNTIDELDTPSLGLFPNPASELLFIESADTGTSYRVFDTTGKQLIAGQYESGLDVSMLPAGSYIMEVMTAEGALRQSRFLVE